MKCKHCGMEVVYDNYFNEYTHPYTGDPQCTDLNGAYQATHAVPLIDLPNLPSIPKDGDANDT